MKLGASPTASGLDAGMKGGEAPAEQPSSPIHSPSPTSRSGAMRRVGSASRVQALAQSVELRHAELLSAFEGLKAQMAQMQGYHAELQTAHADLSERHERTSASLIETSRQLQRAQAQQPGEQWTDQAHSTWSGVAVPRTVRWRFVGCTVLSFATCLALALRTEG